MASATSMLKKGDNVKTWRGTGKIQDIRDVGGIPFVAIKYKSGIIVGTNNIKGISKIIRR